MLNSESWSFTSGHHFPCKIHNSKRYRKNNLFYRPPFMILMLLLLFFLFLKILIDILVIVYITIGWNGTCITKREGEKLLDYDENDEILCLCVLWLYPSAWSLLNGLQIFAFFAVFCKKLQKSDNFTLTYLIFVLDQQRVFIEMSYIFK